MMRCRRDEEALVVAKAVVADVVSVARERRRVITIDGLDIMILCYAGLQEGGLLPATFIMY